jgi:hypothetical protein
MPLAAVECPGCVEKSAELTKHAIDLKLVTFTGACVLFFLILGVLWANAYWNARNETDRKAAMAAPTSMRFLGEAQAASKAEGQTKAQLYDEAKRLNISGRSHMNKSQLLAAVNRKKS